MLTGEEDADSGQAAWAKGAAVVSYNQVLDELDDADTVSHAVNAMPDSLALTATRKSVNRFLAMFQFSEADLKQKIGNLSGGQRARVAMAQCLLSGASVLVLDEPTNHLDLSSTQVMERALVHFPGAVVVVSHDRFFTDKIATRRIVFGARRVRRGRGHDRLTSPGGASAAGEGGRARSHTHHTSVVIPRTMTISATSSGRMLHSHRTAAATSTARTSARRRSTKTPNRPVLTPRPASASRKVSSAAETPDRTATAAGDRPFSHATATTTAPSTAPTIAVCRMVSTTCS